MFWILLGIAFLLFLGVVQLAEIRGALDRLAPKPAPPPTPQPRRTSPLAWSAALVLILFLLVGVYLTGQLFLVYLTGH